VQLQQDQHPWWQIDSAKVKNWWLFFSSSLIAMNFEAMGSTPSLCLSARFSPFLLKWVARFDHCNKQKDNSQSLENPLESLFLDLYLSS
jgi:hypothetical protein